jgi:hypothetical protein
LIALFVHDRLIRPYLGDSLAVALVYASIRAVTPLRIGPAAAPALGVAFAVELGQYLGIVEMLGLSGNRVARVLLGTHYELQDLAAYTLGALAVLAAERLRDG